MNTMFCVIAVQAPEGWSNKRVCEHIVKEMRASRGQLSGSSDDRYEMKYARSATKFDGESVKRVAVEEFK